MNKGAWYAVGAYVAWGLLPVYWKWLHVVPALQLLGHRIIWSCLLLGGFLLATRQGTAFRAALTPRGLGRYVVAAALIAVNWLTYVWAVNAGFIVETSLGYFINPLFSVLLGVIFLRERLRAGQWAPLGLAALGVLYLTWIHGSMPWIALTLAVSFGLYGLVKKTAPLGSVYGLTLETGLLLPPALGYLLYAEVAGQGAFAHTGRVTDILLIGAGLVTTVPLLMFASATRRIPLALVGLLQYIAPTLHFFLGVFVYREPFTPHQLLGFGLVWTALLLFGLEGGLARHRTAAGEPLQRQAERP
jgi:chloramphenicol-sensitive protein RarD